jgi:hypothetical protein
MCREWLEAVDEGFFKQHDRYLDDLQRDILLRCYDSKQKYEQIATELNFDVGHITGKAAELWKLLSDVFGEKVTKANIRGAVKRFQNKPQSIPTTPPKSFKIFISDRHNNLENNNIKQLQKALQETGQETIIARTYAKDARYRVKYN